MNKLFVPYNLAITLKEKGFDEPCFSFYYPYTKKGKKSMRLNESVMGCIFDFRNSMLDCSPKLKYISAPLYQQVTDWLREEHKIQIEMVTMQPDSWLITLQYLNSITPNGVYNGKRVEIDLEEPADYYKSLTIAIEEALKLI